MQSSSVPVGPSKVVRDQVWLGTNGYGTVRVSRVAKNAVFFYPKQGGGAEHRKSREDFLRDFVLVV
jgi:hypothetical protein